MKTRKAFTLTELLIVITIMGILAAMLAGAMSSVREQGREAATKATIAKLNDIIMRRYESYMHRRVPVDAIPLHYTVDKYGSPIPMNPQQFATARLYAIRDLMRMEMPDRIADIQANPITLPNSGKSVPRPVLSTLYLNYYNSHPPKPSASGKGCASAEILYLLVSLGNPEDMEQFTQAEIGDTDGNGWLEFLDGWGRPIFFLRWAPGYSSSDIQVADPVNHHDPFDPRRTDSAAYQLFPLIYSSGALFDPDLRDGMGGTQPFSFASTPDMWNAGTQFTQMGAAVTGSGVGDITNHHIESR